MADRNTLFVYGLLRSGIGSPQAEHLSTHSQRLGPAVFHGQLYLVSHYPGVIPGGEPGARVRGEVFQMHDPVNTLAYLDAFEDAALDRAAGTEYVREWHPVQLVNGEDLHAWIYCYNRSVEGLECLLSGDFMERFGGKFSRH